MKPPHKCGRRHRSPALAKLCEAEAALRKIASQLGTTYCAWGFDPVTHGVAFTSFDESVDNITLQIDALHQDRTKLALFQSLTPTRLQAKNAALLVELKALRTRDKFWRDHYEQLRRETTHLRSLPKPPGGV